MAHRPLRQPRFAQALAVCVLLASATRTVSAATPVLAETKVFVPVALSRAAVGAVPAVRLPPLRWSRVLNDVPVPPDYVLRFYHSDERLAVSDAIYETTESAGGDAADWYRRVMPVLGWRAVRETTIVQQWNREGRRLDIRLPDGIGDGTVQYECRPDCARPADGWSASAVVPMPAGASPVTYDVTDLFVEESLVREPEAAARSSARQVIRDDAWRLTGSHTLAGRPVDRFEKGDESVIVLVWGDSTESRVAVGSLDCFEREREWPDWPQPESAVYLEGLPAPPDAQIVAFAPDDGVESSSESWRAECMDVDLSSGLLSSGILDRGWVDVVSSRSPGSAEVAGRNTNSNAQVQLRTESSGGGTVATSLSSSPSGIRLAEGASLLFPDIPMLTGAMPGRLEADRDGEWPIIEVYASPPDLVRDRESFFRQSMPNAGWQFDRIEPVGVGPSQVYSGGGEEVVVGFPSVSDDVPAMSLARRRVCASDDVYPPPGGGSPSRHMQEMTVFPDAAFENYDDGQEWYVISCCSLDTLVAWYRGAMESGDWALASTVGPEDPFHRELLFVRPDERALPPEQRSAWAQVRLYRPWPYSFRFSLERDPSGVTPSPVLQ